MIAAMTPFESWLIVLGIMLTLTIFAFTADILIDIVASLWWKTIMWRNRRK